MAAWTFEQYDIDREAVADGLVGGRNSGGRGFDVVTWREGREE